MIKEDVRMKKWAPRVLLAAALAGLSAFLLKGDVWTFWTWWLLAFLMGMVAMPVTGRLFAGFEDKGWMFSKVAGDYCDRFSYVVSGNCEDIAIYCSDMYRCVYCMCCWLWGFISFSGKKWN